MKPITVDIEPKVNMKDIEGLAQRLEELYDKYGDLLHGGTPIIYNYYGCSFNYGNHGLATSSYSNDLEEDMSMNWSEVNEEDEDE